MVRDGHGTHAAALSAGRPASRVIVEEFLSWHLGGIIEVSNGKHTKRQVASPGVSSSLRK
jgi:hypothetical protein